MNEAPRRQQGAALMVVLLVVAMISIIAVQLSAQIQLNIRQSSNRQQYQQAYWYARGGEQLARQLLEAALERDRRIHLNQRWAGGRDYPIDGGRIRVSIRDQGACFNVNALSQLGTPQDASQSDRPLPIRQFSALIEALDGGASDIAQLLEPLRDWLDRDGVTSGQHGAEDLYYTALESPYLTANAPVRNLTELDLVAGFGASDDTGSTVDSGLSQRLLDHLCALPDGELTLNLNTLNPEEIAPLAALFENALPAARLQQALASRPTDGFRDVGQFWALLAPRDTQEVEPNPEARSQLRIHSRYFLARIAVDYHDTHLVLHARIRLHNGSARVYQRYYGGLDE